MKKTNMKKAITLIEIILAIVLIAIILGVTIPKLMTNSAKAEIKTVITSDVKSILETAETWRKSSAQASGTFVNITGTALNSRLPSNMITTTNGLILSSGLKTGMVVDGSGANEGTGIVYYVGYTGDVANAGTAGNDQTNQLTLYADFENGSKYLNWNDKIAQYARDVFGDVVTEATDNTAVDETTYNTAIGGVAFNCVPSNNPINSAVCYHAMQVR